MQEGNGDQHPSQGIEPIPTRGSKLSRFFRKPDKTSVPGGDTAKSEVSTNLTTPETRYLHLLTTYNVPWDTEKTARDVWQNFFDGQGGTLDGVRSTTQEGQVTVSGDSEYDYSHLLHMGGGTKSSEDPSTVGGYREGAKVAALMMLTKMGATQVVHESGDWRLTYYLDDVSDYTNGDQPAKGLYARIEKAKHQQGSRFRADFADPKIAKEFVAARDLFYHKDNPDFQDPTYNNTEVGGFKIHVGHKGNVYEGGQRRGFKKYGDPKGDSYAVEDVTIWTRGKVFDPDRDRNAVDKYQVKRQMLDGIVRAMSVDDIRNTVAQNPDFWHKSETLGTGSDLLSEMANVYKYTHKGEPMHFPSEYIASDITTMNFRAELEKAGYIICNSSMSNFGMPTASEAYAKMQEHHKLEPSEAEQERITLLQDFTREIVKLDSPPIWLFSKTNEKSIVHGQHTPDFLWISQEAIHGEFSDALETYLHEIAHGNGRGHDTQFAYTLDSHVQKAMQALTRTITDPTSAEAQRVKNIMQQWEEIGGRLQALDQTENDTVPNAS